MRRLVLVRHAKTEKDSESGKDQDRRLDQRGLSDSTLIATWFSENRIAPDLVLVSSAVRTRQTWEILKAAFPKSEMAFLDDLYLASAMEIFQIVRTTPSKVKTLMIVGHNPGLHEVAWTLTGKADASDRNALANNFPTAAIAVIDFSFSDWKKLMPQEGTLSVFVAPKQLKHEGDN